MKAGAPVRFEPRQVDPKACYKSVIPSLLGIYSMYPESQ
jgi:hypothetical protein